ncbi:MAG: GNAT family N-acetyltransferase [Gammaproteobacteria bacterium]
MTTIGISTVSSLAEVPPAAWNRLIDPRDPFLSHAVLHGMEAHDCLGTQGWQPVHLLAHAGNRLVGALPLYVRDNSYGEFVFDWAWADAYERAGGRYYPKLVTAVPFTPVSGPRLLLGADSPPDTAARLVDAAIRLADDNQLSSWHCLFPSELQLEQFGRAELIRREGCQYHWFNQGYADFDAFLATLTSKRRKEIRRERREVAASGVEIDVLEGAAITPAVWRVFYGFYCDTFDRKWGSPRFTEEFFRHLSRDATTHPVLFMARVDDEYVAGAFALRGADTLFGRHWGCRRFVKHLHFELCYYQTIDYCIRHGLARVDAGAQGEHKVARGFNPVRTWSIHWIRDPAFRRAVRDFCRREAAQVDAYVSSVETQSAYRETDQ